MKSKISRIIALISSVMIMSVTIQAGYASEWSPDTRLTWNTETDWMPSIAQASDGRIWIVWHSYRTGGGDVYYKVYDPSRIHPWSSEIRLTTDPDWDISPSIMQASDGDIWVAWSTNRTGNRDIYYKTYDGTHWSPDTSLTMDPNLDEFPSIMQASDGDIWVAWSTNRTGNGDIYYKTYNGTHWSPDTSLPDQEPADDWDPSIMQTADGEIWFVWVRNDNIYYKTARVHDGIEWSADDTLTTDENMRDWHPSIMQASDDDLWVVWDSDRMSEQEEVYCKVYDNSSSMWSNDTRLTFNEASDIMPSIMQDTKATIWITWASWRLSNLDIYYKTNPALNELHDVAIISVEHSPDTSYAYQGLNLTIEVVPQNEGMEDEDVDVNCYANSTLIGSKTIHLAAGQLMPINFIWNTLKTAPGTYTIKVKASVVHGETETADNMFSNGVIQVRILGDADFSGLVDFDDWWLWWENVGKPAEQWPPNVYPDFNNDNAVTMTDFEIWRKNYGKSYS